MTFHFYFPVLLAFKDWEVSSFQTKFQQRGYFEVPHLVPKGQFWVFLFLFLSYFFLSHLFLSHILFLLFLLFIYFYFYFIFSLNFLFIYLSLLSKFCPIVHMSVWDWSRFFVVFVLHQRPIRDSLVISMHQRNP